MTYIATNHESFLTKLNRDVYVKIKSYCLNSIMSKICSHFDTKKILIFLPIKYIHIYGLMFNFFHRIKLNVQVAEKKLKHRLNFWHSIKYVVYVKIWNHKTKAIQENCLFSSSLERPGKFFICFIIISV